jgi:hypothetical protein
MLKYNINVVSFMSKGHICNFTSILFHTIAQTQSPNSVYITLEVSTILNIRDTTIHLMIIGKQEIDEWVRKYHLY